MSSAKFPQLEQWLTFVSCNRKILECITKIRIFTIFFIRFIIEISIKKVQGLIDYLDVYQNIFISLIYLVIIY